jgi:hypothetical protein
MRRSILFYGPQAGFGVLAGRWVRKLFLELRAGGYNGSTHTLKKVFISSIRAIYFLA